MIAGVRRGVVRSALGDTLIVTLPAASVGEGVMVVTRDGTRIPARVARIDDQRVTIVAYAPLDGVAIGDTVESALAANRLVLGTAALGRAIDAAGMPLDGGEPVTGRLLPVIEPPIPAGAREPVAEPFWTGIRAIDGLLTIGRGARIGVFGAPAAGKSTLIEMLVEGASADAVVVGLIGERGREAASWIARSNPRTTVVCAPLDSAPAERMRAAHVAMAQGAHLRRRGLNVLVILDSLARFIAAARELAVGTGEAVGRAGYPPSVWSEMARLLERGGNCHGGSLTLIATVLSDGGDEREPLSDAARAALDGHIVLSSPLAQIGHYPAIDIVASQSRTQRDVVSPETIVAAAHVRRALSTLERTRDARDLGFATMDPFLTRAVAAAPAIDAFLRQARPGAGLDDTFGQLDAIYAQLRETVPASKAG